MRWPYIRTEYMEQLQKELDDLAVLGSSNVMNAVRNCRLAKTRFCTFSTCCSGEAKAL